MDASVEAPAPTDARAPRDVTTSGPFDAAGLRAWAALLRHRRLKTPDAVIIGALAYVATTAFMRLYLSFDLWAMEGDWKQWIWQYHRYWTPGSFPPGHVITDYQLRVQPPLYFGLMAGLSHLTHPGVAARLLGLVAFAATLAGTYRATRQLSHWMMGVAALVVLMHSDDLFRSTMGGYPRSFGPPLVLLLLDAWLARRHWRALLLLVLMAGLYPSVLPPCGLAYGTFTVLSSIRQGARAFFVKSGTLAFAGALSVGLALLQNLLALPWWGPVIRLHEAQSLAALQPGGRMKWLPMGDFGSNVVFWAFAPFEPSGALPFFGLWPVPFDLARLALGLLVVGLLVAVLALRARGRSVRVPWEVLALVGAACLTYGVARELAFRLYLPHRVIQHTLPYCTIVLLPALAHQALRELRVGLSPVARAVLVAWVPLFGLAGDGFVFLHWGNYSYRAPLLTFLRDQTPIDAQVAGDLAIVDVVPYFAARQVYVNWTMAHPFRLGYWREMERRLLRMHEALYAADRDVVLRFIEEERIDYLALDPRRFSEPDVGRKLFHPIREPVLALWAKNQQLGFVLERPPRAAVVYEDDTTLVLEAKSLVEAWRAP
jgi:hypothetical protein